MLNKTLKGTRCDKRSVYAVMPCVFSAGYRQRRFFYKDDRLTHATLMHDDVNNNRRTNQWSDCIQGKQTRLAGKHTQ